MVTSFNVLFNTSFSLRCYVCSFANVIVYTLLLNINKAVNPTRVNMKKKNGEISLFMHAKILQINYFVEKVPANWALFI